MYKDLSIILEIFKYLEYYSLLIYNLKKVVIFMNAVDRKIIEAIENRKSSNHQYWDFKSATKKSGIHTLMRYPATMVPEMQQELIKILVESTGAKNILDPFMGSGTVLIEGLRNNLTVYGNDINPLAYYLCKSKLKYIPIKTLKRELENLETRIENIDISNSEYYFEKIDKWFKPDIISSLSKLREEIMKINNQEVKEFFLVTLADIVTQTKNSQSSTFKLHIKPEDVIENYQVDVIELYFDKLTKNIMNYESFIHEIREAKICNSSSQNKKVKLSCGDSKSLSQKLKINDGEIDLIVTSPPYGDNHTTVTYGQFSILPLHWIKDGIKKSTLDMSLLNNFNSIDTASLGGKNAKVEIIETSGILEDSAHLNNFYNLLLSLGQIEKARKVASFIIDFKLTLNELSKFLKRDGYMVLVVGNRKVHNIEVPFDNIIRELLENEFNFIHKFDRKIINKKIPTKISRVNANPVESMNNEIILIFRKNV
ncbi:DNA methyltransferase [Lysinibacillus irui]|uniref:site-specific DNA-methyltransferase (cytosine-N(4)-specific) n=1 Tax=Lysinibacillus irui TaxID=2998077 RepID=A0AAJ5RMI5_9BACI|nr:DNA methyltransferase [Lysinibacillus irui]WDV09167.1 DNA methyltransferase [Lysinibacillus irui]